MFPSGNTLFLIHNFSVLNVQYQVVNVKSNLSSSNNTGFIQIAEGADGSFLPLNAQPPVTLAPSSAGGNDTLRRLMTEIVSCIRNR